MAFPHTATRARGEPSSVEYPARSPVSSQARLLVCFGLAAVFMAVEAATGFWAHSLALLSDALHMLSDTVAFALAAGAARLSLRRPTAEKTFGYKRFEVLAAFANTVVLLVLTTVLAVKAAVGFWRPETPAAKPMMVVAGLGLLLNLGMATWLHRGGEEKNLNEDSVLLHIAGDALGSAAALLAGALLYAKGWLWVDPAATLFIAAILSAGAVRVLGRSAHILVEGTPEEVDLESVRRAMLATPQVRDVHDMHVWTLNGRDLYLSAHVATGEGEQSEPQVVSALRQNLQREFGIGHITLQAGQCEAGDCGNGH